MNWWRAGAVVVSLWLAGCASSYQSTWVDPSVVEPMPMAGKSVAVFVMAKNESQRRALEQYMANEITRLGAKGITGHTLLPTDGLKDEARAKQVLQEHGIEAALIFRSVGEREQVRYVPGTTYTGGRYGSLWGGGYWGYAGAHMYDPGHYATDRLVFVETLFYSVPRNKLVWGGVSKSTNPTKLDKVVHTIAEDTVEEMRKSGVLPQR